MTKAAGAGAPVSGALGAALLAAAALLLAPGEARAYSECGSGLNAAVVTCGNAEYADGILYSGAAPLSNSGGTTVNVPGSPTATTTITAAGQGAGIGLYTTNADALTLNVGGETNGVAHVVNIRQGTNSYGDDVEVQDVFLNSGIYMLDRNNSEPNVYLDVKAGVTIGTADAPMRQHGIFINHDAGTPTQGRGAGGAEITNRAPIYAARQGIRFFRAHGTHEDTTITNYGAIHAGVGRATDTTADVAGGVELYRNRPNGIFVHYTGGRPLDTNAMAQDSGDVKIDNRGDITLSGDYVGIYLNHWGSGAAEIDNSGDIDAKGGQGIRFAYNNWANSHTNAVTLTNSGEIKAASSASGSRRTSAAIPRSPTAAPSRCRAPGGWAPGG